MSGYYGMHEIINERDRLRSQMRAIAELLDPPGSGVDQERSWQEGRDTAAFWLAGEAIAAGERGEAGRARVLAQAARQVRGLTRERHGVMTASLQANMNLLPAAEPTGLGTDPAQTPNG